MIRGTTPSKGEHMKHLRVATYEIKKGSFQEIADEAHKGMLRTFQEQPGFVRYGVADVGHNTLVSLSLWETRKDAEASAPIAETWVREHVSDRVELRSSEIGDLAFYEGTAAKV
jgi:heme-degrading monooxygenase HmoA